MKMKIAQNPIITRFSLIGGGQTKGLNPYGIRVLHVCIRRIIADNILELKIEGDFQNSILDLRDIFRRNSSVSPFCVANFSIIKGGIL